MAKKRRWIEPRTFKLRKRDLYFRNFRGINKFNSKDHRITLGIKLPEDVAEQMTEEGWYVRWTKVRDDAPEDIHPIPWLQVTVNMDGQRPPQVNMIVGKTVTELTKETIGTLDAVAIDHMSIKVRAYDWDESDKYGAAAYCVGMNVFCDEDELESELREYMEEEDDEEEPFD